MNENLFSKDELKQIRDVACLLTRKDTSNHMLILSGAAYELWQVFLKFNGDSIYE